MKRNTFACICTFLFSIWCLLSKLRAWAIGKCWMADLGLPEDPQYTVVRKGESLVGYLGGFCWYALIGVKFKLN